MKTILLGLIAITMTACTSVTPAPACRATTPGSNMMVHSFGDSITYGLGSTDMCLAWAALLTEQVGGNSDDGGIIGSRLDQEMPGILALNAADDDIITLLPGFNDVSQFGSDESHLQQFQTELVQALIILNTQGRITLVGTTLRASPWAQQALVPLHTDEATELYVAVIKQVVSQLQSQGMVNLVLVDTDAIFDPTTMTKADVHPDDYGHSILAAEFFKSYQEAQ